MAPRGGKSVDMSLVPVRNPFALRESLEVALEVTWPDVGETQVSCLRALVRVIPAGVGAACLPVGACESEALLACVAHFRRSRTYYWLRSDLSDALADLEHQLRRT